MPSEEEVRSQKGGEGGKGGERVCTKQDYWVIKAVRP